MNLNILPLEVIKYIELFLKRKCWSCNHFFYTYEIKKVNTYNHFTVMDDYWYSERNIDSSKYICYTCLQN